MVSPLSQEMLPQVVASTPANDIPQTGVRLFFLDHLRVWLTMLVIMHHLSLTYALIAPWYYMEPPTDPITSPCCCFSCCSTKPISWAAFS